MDFQNYEFGLWLFELLIISFCTAYVLHRLAWSLVSFCEKTFATRRLR